MAEDAAAGINNSAVEEEAAILRNRLGIGASRFRIDAADSRHLLDEILKVRL